MAKEKNIYDQFASSNVKKVRKISEEEDVRISSGKSDYMKITDGSNKIRIMPKRKNEDHWMINVAKRWITVESEDRKKKEGARRNVLDGAVHGGLSIDPIDAYIEFCKSKLDEDDPEDRRKLKIVTATSFDGGMALSNSWMVYASHVKGGKITKIEKLELNKTLRDAINKEMFIEDDDDPIETDPYTDPKTGRPVIINHDSNAKKGGNRYSVKVADKAIKLEKEDLELLLKMTPLSELLKYDAKQFELALEGIRYVDEEEDINLFEDEEFQEIIEKLKDEMSSPISNKGKKKSEDNDEDEDEEEEPVVTKKKKGKVVDESDDEDEDDEDDNEDVDEDDEEAEKNKFSNMSRKELIKYKKENDCDIKILKSDSDDDIREKLLEYEQNSVDVDEDDEEEGYENDDEDDEEELPVKGKKGSENKKGSSKLTIEDIKRSLKNAGKKK